MKMDKFSEILIKGDGKLPHFFSIVDRREKAIKIKSVPHEVFSGSNGTSFWMPRRALRDDDNYFTVKAWFKTIATRATLKLLDCNTDLNINN